VKYSQQRLAQEILARLATILRERTGDPRLELLSLVEVKVAHDASFARIFYRALGDRADTVAALEKAKPYLRRRLDGHQVVLVHPVIVVDKCRQWRSNFGNGAVERMGFSRRRFRDPSQRQATNAS
jgi:ribosome-binding factor A